MKKLRKINAFVGMHWETVYVVFVTAILFSNDVAFARQTNLSVPKATVFQGNRQNVERLNRLIEIADSSSIFPLLLEAHQSQPNGFFPSATHSPTGTVTWKHRDYVLQRLIHSTISGELVDADVRQTWLQRTQAVRNARYELAMNSGTNQALLGFLHQELNSREGQKVLQTLVNQYMQKGDFEYAKFLLSHADSGFARFRKPGSELVSTWYRNERATNALNAARLVWLDAKTNGGRSQRHLDWFMKEYPEATGALGSKQGFLIDELNEALDRIEIAPPPSRKISDSSQLVELWNRVVFKEGQSEGFANVCDGQSFVWFLDDAIHSANVLTGAAEFESSSPDSTALWQTRFPGFKNQSGPVASIRFSIDGASKRLFATLNDDSSQVVGLDWNREGKLLPGFPTTSPNPGERYNGAPVIHDGRLYVTSLRSEPIQGAKYPKFTVLLNCFELSLIDDSTPLHLIWRKELCQSEYQAGLDARNSLVGMVPVGQRLLIQTHGGVVVSFHLELGRVEWLTTYPTISWQEKYADEGQYKRRRLGQPPVAARGVVYVLPADSHALLAIDLQTGVGLWGVPLPTAEKILNVSDQSLLLGGPQLIWLSRPGNSQTPSISARYPDVFFNLNQSLRRPSSLLSEAQVAGTRSILILEEDEIFRLPREVQGSDQVVERRRSVWRIPPSQKNGEVGKQESRLGRQLFQKDDKIFFFDGVNLFCLSKTEKSQ